MLCDKEAGNLTKSSEEIVNGMKRYRLNRQDGTGSLFEGTPTDKPQTGMSVLPAGNGKIEVDIITAEVRREAYEAAKGKFKSQEHTVLGALFYFGSATALNLHEVLEESILLTSLRRSLTNLKKSGYIKSEGKKQERLGAKNTIFVITPTGVQHLWS